MDDFLTQEEFRRLRDEFVRHMKRIWPLVFSVEDLEDVFQEAVIIYYNNCRKAGKRLYRGIDEKKWIFGIGRNLLKKKWRGLKPKDRAKPLDNSLNNGEVAPFNPFDSEDEQIIKKLLKLLRALPPVDRDIYVAVKAHKISYKELAKEYDRSADGLRVLVNRINNKLRKELGGSRIA